MSEQTSDKETILKDARQYGDVLELNLWYPNIPKEPNEPDKVRELEIGLMHVRAADSIRVSYDFERDGWVIKQAAIFEWDANDKVCDADWKEVAFVQAWARERESAD